MKRLAFRCPAQVVRALHDRAPAGGGAGGLALSGVPLYAALPPERQLEAFAEPPAGVRKARMLYIIYYILIYILYIMCCYAAGVRKARMLYITCL